MNKKNTLIGAFAFSIMAGATASTGEDTDIMVIPVPEDRLLSLHGHNPVQDSDTVGRFTIDARHISFLPVRAIGADFMAVFFDTAKQGTDQRLCPYFNLRRRDYRIVETDHKIYDVIAQATPDEMDSVREHGCIITTRPSLQRIEFRQR